MQIKNNFEKDVYIWGTGNNALTFIKQFSVFFSCEKCKYSDVWNRQIKGFVDSNAKKEGSTFSGKTIYGSDILDSSKIELCIITVFNKDAIIEVLREKGFVDGQWIYWSDYIEICKKNVINNPKNFLNDYEVKSFDNVSGDALVKSIIEYAKATDTELENRLVYHQLFARIENEVINKTSINNYISSIKKHDELYTVIDRLSWEMGDDIQRIYEYAKEIDGYKKTDNKIKTIGMYVDRYYGGGIEKVVSLLIPKLTNVGYRIILITEEINTEKEYRIPEGVIRCNLSINHDGVLGDRLKEIEECIQKHSIDVVCFHSGYARISLFYEVLFLKLLGVKTVCEIHSAFIALIKDQKSISDRFLYSYLLSDKVVALSMADTYFWNGLGCDCKYIANPIEDFYLEERIERNKSDCYKIAWVGRIVQRPKRVLDVVPILAEVRKQIGNVKLQIIGGKDNPADFNNLLEAIKKYKLEDAIDICEYRADIKDIYADADVILMTSASESFSNILSEAGICGRPVVMYDIPWLPILEDNEGVIRVKQRDIEGAAKAIIKLLLDEKLWESCSVAANDNVQKFIKNDVILEWKNLFDELENSCDNNQKVMNQKGQKEVLSLFMEQLCEKGYPYNK